MKGVLTLKLNRMCQIVAWRNQDRSELSHAYMEDCSSLKRQVKFQFKELKASHSCM